MASFVGVSVDCCVDAELVVLFGHGGLNVAVILTFPTALERAILLYDRKCRASAVVPADAADLGGSSRYFWTVSGVELLGSPYY